METITGKFTFLRAIRMFPTVGAVFMVLEITIIGTGCIIVPVSSTSPVSTGLVDETTLESFIGLNQEEVSEQIGQPDYWGSRGDSYVLVYQGVETWSTDIYVAGLGPLGIPSATKTDTIYTEVIYCYVTELNHDSRFSNTMQLNEEQRWSPGRAGPHQDTNPLPPSTHRSSRSSDCA